MSFRPIAIFIALAGAAWAQLADGPGKEQTVKICSQCHELERSFSLRQDRDGWTATINKMIGLGAEGSDQDFKLVIDYLSKNFPGEPIPKLNVNTAKAIDFESALSLRRSQSAAIIDYRIKYGPFNRSRISRKFRASTPRRSKRKRTVWFFNSSRRRLSADFSLCSFYKFLIQIFRMSMRPVPSISKPMRPFARNFVGSSSKRIDITWPFTIWVI